MDRPSTVERANQANNRRNGTEKIWTNVTKLKGNYRDLPDEPRELELSGVNGSIDEHKMKRLGTAGTTWTSTGNAGKARKDLDENVTNLDGVYPTSTQWQSLLEVSN